MTDKTFQQMKSEYREFYFKAIKPLLGSYNKNIRAVNSALGTAILFLLSVILLPFFPSIIWIAVVLCLGFRTYYLFSKKDTVYLNEMSLKTPLMSECMGIFLDNVYWTTDYPRNTDSNKVNIYSKICSWWKKLREFKSQHITKKFFIAFFDDIIYGKYKDVDIAIYETIADTTSGKFIPYLIVFWIILLNLIHNFFEKFLGIDASLWLILVFAICIICWFIDNKISKKFRGLIIEFNTNKKNSGHTFFVPKSYTKNMDFNKKLYKPVKLEYSAFTKNYDVYSDNQVVARYILTPSFMERIEQLQFAFKAEHIGCSFKDNKLTLSIQTGKDMFAMGKEYRESNTKIFETLYDEMISVLQIVDELKLNENIGL